MNEQGIDAPGELPEENAALPASWILPDEPNVGFLA
jgi:hypothetical protein